MLQSNDLPCSWDYLWPGLIYRLFNSGRIPFGRRIFRSFFATPLAMRSLRPVKKGDTAWIISFCSPFSPHPGAESAIRKKGAKYLFQVVDDWFDIPELRESTLRRCRLADAIGVPTPSLARRVLEFVPEKNVLVFEEPIQIHRFEAIQQVRDPIPTILWNGNPYNLQHASMLMGVLRRIHRKCPFRFRFICAKPPPKDFGQGLDMQYLKYNANLEAQQISGSWLGLAPMPDTGHNRCKGAYKVKTYFAAGLPVVASPVGFQQQLVAEGGEVGFLPESTEAWEKALLSFLKNPDLSLRMGKTAYLYAQRRFSYEAVASSWVSHLRNLMRQDSLSV